MDNFTPDISALLVRYLDGELTGPEKQELEQQLAENKNLRDQLENLRLAKDTVHFYGIQQQVSDIHKNMMNEMNQERGATVVKMDRSRKIFRYSMAVAASVLILFVGIKAFNFFTVSSGNIYSNNYSSYELNTVRNTGQAPAPIEKAYRSKNFREVISIAESDSLSNAKDFFLAGMAWLELDDPARAISDFNKTIHYNQVMKTTSMQDETEYYLALAYIKNKDYAPALSLLEKIKNNADQLYSRKVTRKLIRGVRMLKWRS